MAHDCTICGKSIDNLTEVAPDLVCPDCLKDEEKEICESCGLYLIPPDLDAGKATWHCEVCDPLD